MTSLPVRDRARTSLACDGDASAQAVPLDLGDEFGGVRRQPGRRGGQDGRDAARTVPRRLPRASRSRTCRPRTCPESCFGGHGPSELAVSTQARTGSRWHRLTAAAPGRPGKHVRPCAAHRSAAPGAAGGEQRTRAPAGQSGPVPISAGRGVRVVRAGRRPRATQSPRRAAFPRAGVWPRPRRRTSGRGYPSPRCRRRLRSAHRGTAATGPPDARCQRRQPGAAVLPRAAGRQSAPRPGSGRSPQQHEHIWRPVTIRGGRAVIGRVALQAATPRRALRTPLSSSSPCGRSTSC